MQKAILHALQGCSSARRQHLHPQMHIDERTSHRACAELMHGSGFEECQLWTSHCCILKGIMCCFHTQNWHYCSRHSRHTCSNPLKLWWNDSSVAILPAALRQRMSSSRLFGFRQQNGSFNPRCSSCSRSCTQVCNASASKPAVETFDVVSSAEHLFAVSTSTSRPVPTVS